MPSFFALIPHLHTAHWDVRFMAPLVLAGAVGAFLGARLTSLYVPSGKIKQAFGALIVLVTLYKIYSLIR